MLSIGDDSMSENELPKDSLNRADLYLLLDSYKNSVEISTVISEQLRQIAELQTKFSDEEKDLLQKQKEIYDCLLKIVDLLKTYSNEIKESNDKVSLTITGYEKNLATFQVEQKGWFDKVISRIYLIYIGIGSVVISLCGIIYLLLNKIEILSEIAKNLGIGSNLP
jgi:hypothetical protein